MQLYKELSGKDVAEGLAQEMIDQGPSVVIQRLSSYFPKELIADVTTHDPDIDATKISKEDWAIVDAVRQSMDINDKRTLN